MYSLIMVNNVNGVTWDEKNIPEGGYLGKYYVCGGTYANKWVKFKVVRLYEEGNHEIITKQVLSYQQPLVGHCGNMNTR